MRDPCSDGGRDLYSPDEHLHLLTLSVGLRLTLGGELGGCGILLRSRRGNDTCRACGVGKRARVGSRMKTCIFNDDSRGVEIKTAHAARVCAHIVFNRVVIHLALCLIFFFFVVSMQGRSFSSALVAH